MVLNERQAGIENYLKEKRHASVRELAARFYVSEMTVRRDLRQMEQEGYLRRYNGGATCLTDDTLPFEARRLLHAEDKARIMQAVRPLLQEGLSVFLDSSSTCLYLVPLLSEYRRTRIFTNSLSTALSAAEHHIPCTLIGGDCYERDLCTVGTKAVDFLRQINVDTAFFSVQGIADDGRVTDSDEPQTAVRQAALANSRRNILLMDESKRHKTFLYTFCHTDQLDAVIYL